MQWFSLPKIQTANKLNRFCVPNSLQTQELVQVVADCAIEDCKGQDWDAIALPGGEGGARVESLCELNLLKSKGDVYHLEVWTFTNLDIILPSQPKSITSWEAGETLQFSRLTMQHPRDPLTFGHHPLRYAWSRDLKR